MDVRNTKDLVKPDSYNWKVLLIAPTGLGKCFAPGTEVLMADGSIETVENIKIGDTLMGPDSQPRNVLSLGHGTDLMYRIVPVKGEPFIVNGPHTLALKRSPAPSGQQAEVELSVDDYIKQSPSFKRTAKLWRVGVDFASQPVPLDPYMLGVWLGDGDSHEPIITNMDDAVIKYVCTFANTLGATVRTTGIRHHIGLGAGNRLISNPRKNPFTTALRQLRVLGNKHIPDVYKHNSREVRLQILAGLLDTDGSLSHKVFDYVSKSDRLADDVAFLVRSLGMAAYVKQCEKICTNTGSTGTYWRVTISGEVSEIPTKIARKQAAERKQVKSVRHTGFSVESLGTGQYFGFEIDGDKLFLLADFTVVHNSTWAATAPSVGVAACETGEGSGTLSIVQAGVDFVEPRNFADFRSICYDTFQPFQKKRTIVLDSLSYMCKTFVKDHVLSSFPAKNPREAMRRQAGVPSGFDYSEISEVTRGLLNALLGQKKHVIVTTLAKSEKDENGVITNIKPDLPGALGDAAAAMFDSVLFLKVRKLYRDPKDPKSAFMQRYFITQPDGVHTAKDRNNSGKPFLSAEEIFDKDTGQGAFPDLLNKILAGHATAQQVHQPQVATSI